MTNNNSSDEKQSTAEPDQSKNLIPYQGFEWHHEPRHHKSFNWHHEPRHHKSFNWHHEPYNWLDTFTDRWY